MPPNSLSNLLATLNAAVQAASNVTLLASLNDLKQLTTSLEQETPNPSTLAHLSSTLAESLLPLLLAYPSPTLALFSGIILRSLGLLKKRYSGGGEEGWFSREGEKLGVAVEGALEGVLRGMKSYVDDVDREQRLTKKDRELVGATCFTSLVAVLAPPKLRIALKRKTLDILDYSISHHPTNKDRLIQSALLGPKSLGALLATSEDFGLTERALELAWRLRDHVRSTSGKGGKERVEKWDSLLWEKVGEGVRKRVVAMWRETSKESYEKDAVEILDLLSSSTSGDLTRFQTIHALTLTANGQKFIEDPSASSAADYDQAVSFNRSTFTATTTRDLSDSDAVQEVLELELASVERVLVRKDQDVLGVRIVSFHPPTLESAPMPMDKGAENGEHYITFTIRLEDGARLSEVLDTRELIYESTVDFHALGEDSATLPAPKKKLPPATDFADTLKAFTRNSARVAGYGSHDHRGHPHREQVRTRPHSKPATRVGEVKSQPALLEVPVAAVKPTSKSSVPSSRAPVGKKLPAEVRVESPMIARPAAPKLGSNPKDMEVQVGHSLRAHLPEVVEVGGKKRKAVGGDGAENEGAASMPWDQEEVAVGGSGARKKQRLSEGEGSGRKSKSVAFKSRSQLEVRSPTQPRPSQNFSIRPFASPFGPSTERPLHSSSPPAILVPASDEPFADDHAPVEDSGYGPSGLDWEDGELGDAEEEEQDDELVQKSSQALKGRSRKGVKKVLEILGQDEEVEGGEEVGDEKEQSRAGGEHIEKPQSLLFDSPTRPTFDFNAPAERPSPFLAAHNQVEQNKPLPIGLFRQRTGKGRRHGSASKRHGRKSVSATVGKGDDSGVKSPAAQRGGGKKKGDKKDQNGCAHGGERPQKGRTAGVQQEEVSALDGSEQSIRSTLAELSEIVLSGFVHRRQVARSALDDSKLRIADRARSLGMAFHEQTQAVVEASVEQVNVAKSANEKLQAMGERRKGFGEKLRRALGA